jgi:DNA polymerase/3'-5' exonuclease PolX
MNDGIIYNDMRGPLDQSVSSYEQELFYCEFSDEQIEKVRVAFGGDLQRASSLYRDITNKIIMDVSEEDLEKPLAVIGVEELIKADNKAI